METAPRTKALDKSEPQGLVGTPSHSERFTLETMFPLAANSSSARIQQPKGYLERQ
jgi:hypothetical protein